MSNKETGRFGEAVAVKYLEKNGYRILDRNYEVRLSGGPRKGEIDIVVQKDKTISFVEVKTINESAAFYPEQKVDFLKQKKTMKAAQFWLMKNKIPLDAPWQLDVVAIEIDADEKVTIRHLKNAVFC